MSDGDLRGVLDGGRTLTFKGGSVETLTPAWRMLANLLVVVVAIVVLAFMSHGVQAQDEVAWLATRSFTPLADKVFAVEPETPLEVNDRLAGVIVDQLSKRGYTADQDAAAELTFSLDVAPVARRERRVEGLGRESSPEDEESFGLRFNLNRPKTGKVTGLNRYRLTMRIVTGRRMIAWSGSATAYVAGSDRFTVGSALARILVVAVDQTVEAEQRPLRFRSGS